MENTIQSRIGRAKRSTRASLKETQNPACCALYSIHMYELFGVTAKEQIPNFSEAAFFGSACIFSISEGSLGSFTVKYSLARVLDRNGEAWVEMPEWFEALNRDFRYQLTPIGAPAPNLYIAEPMTLWS